MIRTAAVRMATVLALSASVLIIVPPAAVAACPEETRIRITRARGIHMWDRKTYFKDGPGGVMTGKVEDSSTISATLSVGAEISVDALVTSVKAQVTASATKSRTTTIGHEYSRNIDRGKYGNMKYGSWGRKVAWQKVRYNRDCTTTVLDTGTGRVPTRAVGWRFWHTNS